MVGEKRTLISLFCGDVSTSKEKEVAPFYEDYIGSSGAAHMKEIYRLNAVEICGCLCILFPAERKPGIAATKVSFKFKCIFFKDHLHSILFTNIE